MNNKKTQTFLQLGLFIGILVFLNVLGNYFYTYFDLTEEKRYTLTKPTRQMLQDLDDVVYVQVLLDGKFPAGFKRLQNAVLELLEDFRSEASVIEFQFDDPTEGSVEEINARREQLAKDGILPINLRVEDVEGSKETLIYPYAIFNYKGRAAVVNFLEASRPGIPQEVVLNNSVSLLEYKFANAIQKLQGSHKPNIAFLEGHGELHPLQVMDFERNLRQYYDTYHFSLDTVMQLPAEEVDVVLVAKPRGAFSEQDKFKIDQYIMNGGRMLWLIDKLNVNIDSINRNQVYVPFPYPLDLDNLLFKYGIRLDDNLVLDLECSPIPLKVGDTGGQPQFRLFPFFYHPVVASKSEHPIVKSLDRIDLFFPSSIDTTVRTKTEIKKTVLLNSSQRSRIQLIPTTLNFEVLREKPNPALFNQPFQPLAVLYEGIFPSAYENRVTQSMMDGLNQLGLSFKVQSVATKIIVVADGDLIRNEVRLDADGKPYPLPLGQNPFDGYVYANKDFLLNAIEYLLDENGIIEARSKDVKLRLLDEVRASSEQTKWQLINLVLPLLFLGVFGIVFNGIRKRRFG